ncbi:MAG: hypothetical protein H0W75_01040 [Chitinophagaceae bacterium]|nr:hypothetical protein [Chitinophagaceae bacterium]
METLTHLKTSPSILQKEDRTHSKLVVDKFIEACVNLDASIFEPYMSEDDVFNSLAKYEFLAELKDLFEYSLFKTDHDFNINMTNEQYDESDTRESVLHFEVMFARTILPVGDFTYCIEMVNDNLTDIYRYTKIKKWEVSELELKGLTYSLCDECEKLGFCKLQSYSFNKVV